MEALKRSKKSYSSLLRKNFVDLETIKSEMAAVKSKIDRQTTLINAIAHNISNGQVHLDKLANHASGLDINQFQTTSSYIISQEEQLESARMLVQELQSEQDNLMQKLVRCKKEENIFEKKLKETGKKIDFENNRNSELEVNDLWLSKELSHD